MHSVEKSRFFSMEIILKGEKSIYSSVFLKAYCKILTFYCPSQTVFDKCLHEQVNFIAPGDFKTELNVQQRRVL